MKKVYTIGYGGRDPKDFVGLLKERGVKTVIDVRMSPKGYMSFYSKAKTRDKGIEALLSGGGIEYVHMPDLGNPYFHNQGWRAHYANRLAKMDPAWKDAVLNVRGTPCLLCAEKDPTECHRSLIADALAEKGTAIEHIR